jgi:hypothetical protein
MLYEVGKGYIFLMDREHEGELAAWDPRIYCSHVYVTLRVIVANKLNRNII